MVGTTKQKCLDRCPEIFDYNMIEHCASISAACDGGQEKRVYEELTVRIGDLVPREPGAGVPDGNVAISIMAGAGDAL